MKEEFGIELVGKPEKKYHAVILTVAHKEFISEELRSYLVDGGVLYDVKGVLEQSIIDARL